MTKRIPGAVIALLFVGSFTLTAQTPAPVASGLVTAIAPPELHSFNPAYLDTAVDPCTDFYKYACGSWIRTNPIPADQERVWIPGQLTDRNTYLLYAELKQAAEAPSTPLEKQYGTFFAACMDIDQANALGTQPIKPTLAAIEAIRSKTEIAAFLADRRYMGEGFFSFLAEQDEKDATKEIAVLRQNGLTLPGPEDYLATGDRQAAMWDQYRRYLVTVFALLGDGPNEADAEAKNASAIETALAKASMSRVDMRDPDKTYHLLTLTQLGALAPDFEWQTYFAGTGAPAFTMINVEQPDYLRAMAQVIAGQPLAALKSYLRIHALDQVAPYLSAPFAQASFDFFTKTLRGQAMQQARWKSCTALTDKQLSDAVARRWVEQNFSPEKKAQVEQMLANLRNALSAEIAQLPWLSPAAKAEAEKKIRAMRQKIGYPNKWRDSSIVQITSANFVADLHNVEVFHRDEQLGRIGKAVDEGQFYWTPPTADANYDEHLNDIEFPAGILQPPYYSESIDAAVNYGALGSLAGHEMTHGFDDTGSRYDEHGNIRDWFTSGDRLKFDQMTSCEEKEYGSFEPVPGVKLDGALSLGEDTADNGGIRIAYNALQDVLAAQPSAERDRKIDGYTEDQRFFISFAQTWCEQRRDAYQRVRGATDPHPPGEFRVNGTVQNFAQFGKAFSCHAGQPMMPARACHIW